MDDDPRFIKPDQIRRIELAKLDNFNEAKLRDFIVTNPAVLGLGEDLQVKGIEKKLPGGGRLDLLLSGPDDDLLYEVELQFGKTDESHIIRSLEYWDLGRKRYPEYDHIAVLVAEDITSRFLNVISLFNGCVPIMALKLNAFMVNDKIILNFVKVLDKVDREELDDVEEPKGATREYWVEKSSEEMVSIVDTQTGSFKSMLQAISPALKLKYNLQYIGTEENGIPNVFAAFKPKRKMVNIQVKLRDLEPDELDACKKSLEDEGLVAVRKTGGNWLHFQLGSKQDLDKHQEFLKNIFRKSYEMQRRS